MLDVGGGPGYFADAFRAAGATYYAIDSDLGELSGRGEPVPGTVLGSGMALPIADGQIDICFSSNVLEHVPDPWLMADEMVRVTRPGGTVFLSYTGWWGRTAATRPPLALPRRHIALRGATSGGRASHRRTSSANRSSRSLWPAACAGPARAATPSWWRPSRGTTRAGRTAYWRCPGLREFATWNLVVVLRRR